MGIQGLFPLLKSIQKPCHIKKFSGQTLGVDAYGWLHRGAASCAIEMAQGKVTTKHVKFAMHRVRMLLHFGITPYMVFDGDYLPSKEVTECQRAARREESKKKGLELLSLGKSALAHQELQKAVDVTPEIAGLLIEELKQANVPYVVAPYEADSQLAYLERTGHIQGVISEDSDLLVFGARVLLTKLDQYGECVMVRRDDFTACREISLVGWTDQQFRHMAILSGCDYLDSIDKMGLKTAYRLLRKHKTVQRVLQAVQFEGKMKVPPRYLGDFTQADMTFLYQWVFCPDANALVNLTKPEPWVDVSKMPYLGATMESEIAVQVARGLLNPHTKRPLKLPEVKTPSRGPTKTPPSRRVVATEENLPDKKNKTITSFFKTRQPLAELDPNSFVLTPTQEATLRRSSGASWSSVHVGDENRSTQATPNAAPASAYESARRQSRGSIGRRSLDTSVKRRRLCTEEVGVSPSIGIEGRSKFFSKTKPSKKRNGQDEFNIFSDDSVEVALSQIPDTSLLVETRTHDASQSPAKSPVPSRITSHKDERQEDASQATLVASSAEVKLKDTQETLVEHTSVKKGLFDRFSLRRGHSQGFLRERTVYTETRQRSNIEKSMEKEESEITVDFTAFADKLLQKRGSERSAEVDDQVCSGNNGAELPEFEHEAALSPQELNSTEFVVPASDGADMDATLVEKNCRGGIKGSEDFLVSESELEGGGEDVDFSDDDETPKLNLSRFVFDVGAA